MLVSPSTPITAFSSGRRSTTRWPCTSNDLCTIPSNLAGNAAASFPCGLAPEDGLPVGFQVMAPPLADDRLYRVGARPRTRAGRRARADQLWARESSNGGVR